MNNQLIRKVPGMEKVAPYVDTEVGEGFYQNSIHILGFKFDGTSCFRKGADFGPDAIRDVSEGFEDYSPYLDRKTTDRSIFDLGNLPHYPQDWQKTTDFFLNATKDLEIEKNKIRILTLGGEHSISFAPIKTYLEAYPDLYLLHLDAHADLRNGYLNEKYSHASIIFNAHELMGKKHNLLQYGIRSGTQEEFQMMKEMNSRAESRDEFLTKVKNIPTDRPIYLTLDLDYFDPAFMPGTGTPEAGGEDFHSFIALMKILKDKNFVGADVVELAPKLDTSNNSACFATKVIREILVALRV